MNNKKLILIFNPEFRKKNINELKFILNNNNDIVKNIDDFYITYKNFNKILYKNLYEQ